MNILILQHGDYADAYRRFEGGGAETYRNQKRSVEFVTSLTSSHSITTIAVCDRVHDEALTNDLRSVGIAPATAWDRNAMHRVLSAHRPDLLILRTPNRFAAEWASRKGIPTLPIFADLFRPRGLRNHVEIWRTSRAFSGVTAPCFANHSLSASQSLHHLGIPRERIVPWDWNRLPVAGPPKHGRDDGALRLFYAGVLSEPKGVGDVIEAVAIASRDVDVAASFAGPGDTAPWTRLADDLDVADRITMLGCIPADSVLARMRDADAVVVPSRHSYPEGLPNTVFESLASRSPLLSSDHPSFASRLAHGVNTLQFRAGQPADLADQITRLARDPALYHRLSANSEAALAGLYVGVEWDELVRLFINDPSDASGWVKPRSLKTILREREPLGEAA